MLTSGPTCGRPTQNVGWSPTFSAPSNVIDSVTSCTESVPVNHRIIVVRRENHHMRVPGADSRGKVLVGGPHIREAHSVSLG
jgi:hypothetical protein